MMELAGKLKIQQLQGILADKWRPFMENLDTMCTDATCYESEMLYPTDAKLLWEGVKKSYATMCELSNRLGIHRPRTKFLDVQKANLTYRKQRKHSRSQTRKIIRWLLDLLGKILKEIREIERGKEVKSVEFGAKVNNILVDGISFIEKLSFNAFNEGTRLVHCLKMHKRLFGVEAKKVGGDTGYAGTENRDYCKANGNPLHLLRHPHGKRGAAGGQDRTEVEFGGCLTLKLAVNAELMCGNCILAMKNGQKIRLKRPETDIKLKF